jgi:hypothetical protein
MVKQKEEYKSHIKNVKSEEKTKIQEEIDSLTSSISTSKTELESLNSAREELITEETTQRTELTYTS